MKLTLWSKQEYTSITLPEKHAGGTGYKGGTPAADSPADIPENAGSQEVSEEEAAYGECIVDGIYYHGYTFYDLSDEEKALLDELISYTEAGRYEEYAMMLNAEEYEQAWKALTAKYESSALHIANVWMVCLIALYGDCQGFGIRTFLWTGVHVVADRGCAGEAYLCGGSSDIRGGDCNPGRGGHLKKGSSPSHKMSGFGKRSWNSMAKRKSFVITALTYYGDREKIIKADNLIF